MGMYKYLAKLWKKPKANFGKMEWRDKHVAYRKQPAMLRLEKPTRLDRARALGYRAKKGFVIVRCVVKKGTTKRPNPKGGRRPKRYGRVRFTPAKSKQRIAEERVSKKYVNLEVLNSYWVGDDSKHEWFEVILVDPDAPAMRKDRKLKWLQSGKHKRRAERGLVHRRNK